MDGLLNHSIMCQKWIGGLKTTVLNVYDTGIFNYLYNI